MEIAEALARQHASLRAFLELFVGGSPGARLLPTPAGVTALICPARPERSLVNAVVYDDTPALAKALPLLTDAYAAEGIHAWTVWLNVGDHEAAQLCADAGHTLDDTPELMWAALDELPAAPSPPPGVTLLHGASWSLLGDVNDAAYGLPHDHLSIALRDVDPGRGLRTVAVQRDQPVACAAVDLVDADAHAILVATLPAERNRGLATLCLADALQHARDAGATSTTLEATKLGAPMYQRMGYRVLGTVGMWERRLGSG